MKILYHHRTQGRGAEGVHILSIVNALTALGHDVTVLSPPGIDPLENAGNAPVDKSNVKTSGVNSLWKFISKKLPDFIFEFIEIVYNLPAMRRLENELSSNNYDMIYERYAFYMIAGAIKSKKYNIPLVLEANEVNGIKDRARKQTFQWLCNVFERFLFKRCKSIHTVSSYLKNMIVAQGVAEENIIITPNAIDPLKFSGVKSSGELTQKYNLEDRIVLGFAGWFDNWDRLDILIEVFNDLKLKYPNISLLLVGDGAVLDCVRSKAKEYNIEDDVILTGAVTRDTVQQYLSLLDIAVITHSNEFGSPVVMFEFMGLKIPVVAPRLLPVTDVLTHKKNALLFDVLDTQALKEQLSLMIESESLRHDIAENAYKKLMTDHTWEKNAEHIINTSGLVKS